MTRLPTPGQAPGRHRSASRLILQWHVTERCNLRCTHCYQGGYAAPETDLDGLLTVLAQYKDLLARRRRDMHPLPVHGQINVTGGEPFVRPDFLDLLDAFDADGHVFSFAIMTNGTFIDAPMARRLRDLRPTFVQVSVEGGRETNDRIRGVGALDRTCEALRHLVRERVPTAISFTAQRSNFREFVEAARLGRELGVSRVWSDRLIPCGSADRDEVLSPEETRELFETMYRAHNASAGSFCRTDVSMSRALQFLVAGGRPYRCAAGGDLITILPNGDLLPCRRMPIVVGNVMETPLVELYFEDEFLQRLRDRSRIAEGCEACSYAKRCGGGLRCLAYAMTGDPFKADPGCWRAHQPAGSPSGATQATSDGRAHAQH